ncbi:adhesin Scl1, partial [Streptococcus pyogenes]
VSSTTMTSSQRESKIKEIEESLKKYPEVSNEKFWERKWYGTYFKEEDFQKELKDFTEKRLKEILDLIGKSGIKGDRGETGPAGPAGP